MRDRDAWTWKRPEFIVLVVMLLALIVLVWEVLWIPIEIPLGDATTNLVDVLNYRRSILVVIGIAFVAWMGVGAAYFFVLQRLRDAASSLVAKGEPTTEASEADARARHPTHGAREDRKEKGHSE